MFAKQTHPEHRPAGTSRARGDVNNGSGFGTSFHVVAVCAKKPNRYAVVTATVFNPAGTQSSASATCPAGSLPLGGGAVSGSSQLSVNLNTSLPLEDVWRVDESNASTSNTSLVAFAVCGKVNSSEPLDGGWLTLTNNSTPGDTTSVPTVVCAGK